MIFIDQTQVSTKIAIKVVGIAEHYVQLNPNMEFRNIQQEQINLEIPWGYFDGVAGVNPSLCGF